MARSPFRARAATASRTRGRGRGPQGTISTNGSPNHDPKQLQAARHPPRRSCTRLRPVREAGCIAPHGPRARTISRPALTIPWHAGPVRPAGAIGGRAPRRSGRRSGAAGFSPSTVGVGWHARCVTDVRHRFARPFRQRVRAAGNAVMTESTASPRRLVEWLRLIRSEFRDEPDMRVTLQQAADHWDVDQPVLAPTAMTDSFVTTTMLWSRRSAGSGNSTGQPVAVRSRSASLSSE